MDGTSRYTMLIQWSTEDDTFVVSFPDWEGVVTNPVTHGDTYEQAVRNGQEAIDAMVASTLKHGETLPMRKAIQLVAAAA